MVEVPHTSDQPSKRRKNIPVCCCGSAFGVSPVKNIDLLNIVIQSHDDLRKRRIAIILAWGIFGLGILSLLSSFITQILVDYCKRATLPTMILLSRFGQQS